MHAHQLVSPHLHPHSDGSSYLATELGRIVRECTDRHTCALKGWNVSGLLLDHPGTPGDMLVIVGRRHSKARSFPWRLLDEIAREVAAHTWRVVAIVPDIESTPPR